MIDDKFELTLRPTEAKDLETLFEFQCDQEAASLAAFMPKDATDKIAYLKKHLKLLNDPTVNNQTILLNNSIVGSVAKYIIEPDAEITYWIDRKYWRRGIATTALKKFLEIESTRPIVGRVAFDNLGSQKVLEKCGFIKIGADKGFANARQTEIEEFIYRLSN
ncbi:GNAT family N-acetyltransferase [Pedobacter sandarakinus]|uniref:GNAT family N-acetyltransferase n=1 Tax=Pedobacter sandarakinus TaxID=353156 RepID=UPI00224749D5|nr:GNAT family N-acetyltransferase [Pedobacter sandarakinus]MCX2574648.1 GNAT family N-acetyltransferase [Pedobacter sandarakinus]